MLARIRPALSSRLDRSQLNQDLLKIKSQGSSNRPSSFSFESLRPSPTYQDLTHTELAKLKHARARELQLDRKALWMKRQNISDPVIEAKKQHKQAKLQSHSSDPTNGLIYTDPVRESKRIRHLESQAERLSLESKLRGQVRKQKQASSLLAHTGPPTLSNGPRDVVLDPLKRQIALRKERLQIVFKQYIDEYLVFNSSQIVNSHLDGASVSVVRVHSDNYRKTQVVTIRIQSEHKPEWVIDRLNVLAPKLRSQIAQRVNLGYMPEIKFVLGEEVRAFNKGRLLRLANEAVQPGDKFREEFEKEMNW
jgi:ribosome-binding factor A